ncbi:MAG: outer membrane protein assembly factor BamD [Acidihalobacter sp.]
MVAGAHLQRGTPGEARYPFGKYATQAQLNIAYAYYRNSEPKSAMAAAQRFINEHPRSPHIDYAYYLMGLADFQSTSGIVAFFRPNSAYEVDVTPLRKSFLAFKTLLEKFPHSRYAPDARKRMVYLRNQLAAHELYVAHYYMRRGAYVAVVNRCKDVLTTYAGSSPGAEHDGRGLRQARHERAGQADPGSHQAQPTRQGQRKNEGLTS